MRLIRKGSRGLLLGALPALLAAQGLPPATVLAPLDAPTPAELLPLRPFQVDGGPGTSRVPFDWRGEKVSEAGDIWVLEKGAIVAEGILLLADRIEYRIPDGRLVAEGHIRLEGPDVRLRCERLQMDWVLRSGEAWALQMDLPPTWTLRSGHVAFATLRTWTFDEVELSPCPEEKPGWKARLSSLKVDLDGWATLWNAWLQLGSVPVFYLPYAIYPAQAERTSGLMSPKIALSSAYGATFGISYYQVLGETADITFSPEYLSDEGMLWGGEARWHPDLTHQGSVSGLTIHQRSIDTQRYRYGLKEVWQREDGWQATADVNQASDNLVDADFGRGIAYLGAPSYDSALYLGRSFTFGSFAMTATEQRSFFTTAAQGDPFYSPDFPASLRRQTYPKSDLRLFPIPMLGSIYLDGGLQLGRFAYRIEDSSTTPNQSYIWDRQDANTRLHGRLGQWGPFRADFEMMGRATHYSATLGSSVFDPTNGASGTPLVPTGNPFEVDGPPATRYLLSGHLRLSGPQAGRTFKDLSFLGYSGDLKHTLEPYFGFTDTSGFAEAGMLPRFDNIDSYPGVNMSASGERSLELGLMQHLLGRSGPGQGLTDLVRLRIATRYYFTPVILSDGRYEEGWATLDTDMDVEPNDRWRVSFRRSSDIGQGGTDNSISLDVKATDGSRFNLAYFSTGINQFSVQQKGIQLGGIQRHWDDRIRLEFSANYDFNTHGFASGQVALAYVRPCVAYVLKYTHVATSSAVPTAGLEDRVDVTLTLRGVGDLFSFGR